MRGLAELTQALGALGQPVVCGEVACRARPLPRADGARVVARLL